MASFLPAPIKTYQVFGAAAAAQDGFPVPAPRAPAAGTALATASGAPPGAPGFDAIILAQHRGKASLHTSFSDLVPHAAAGAISERPDAAAAAAVRDRTAAALDAMVSGAMANVRTGAAATVAASAASGAASSRIIRYTPDEDAPGFNPAARTRIIKMVGAAVDPLEPPKHQHKKMPSGPPDAPVPIMHSPTRKATAEDRTAWKIPPCVSNYKNPKGFVIPLDKRIAADGRTLLEAPAVSDHRAKLAEALQLAERKAREEVEVRAALQRKLAAKEKEEREAEMRALAQRARLERGGVVDLAAGAGGSSQWGGGGDFEGGSGGGGGGSSSSGAGLEGLGWAPPLYGGGGGGSGAARVAEGANRPAWMTAAEGAGGGGAAGGGAGAPAPGGALAALLGGYGAAPPASSSSSSSAAAAGESAAPPAPLAGESSEEYSERMERERQRREFRREAEREARGGRAGREARDGERDMSERVALGMGVGGKAAVAGGGESMFDSRLFNQGGGVKSGFAAEEEDQETYDSAWRGGTTGSALAGIYRPRSSAAAGGALSEAAAAAAVEGLQQGAAKRFRAGDGRDFEGGAPAQQQQPVSRAAGPVEFERGPAGRSNLVAPVGSGDVFGLDALLGGGGGAPPPQRASLAGIGKGGGMAAAAGGASRTAAELAQGGRREIKFTSATGP